MFKILKKIVLFILVFLLIFRPEFIFIPFGINKFFGALGLFVYFIDKRTRRKLSRQTSVSFKPFFILLLPPLLWSIVSLIINGSSDIYFPKYVLSVFLAFFAAYLIAWLSVKVYGEVSSERLIKYMVYGGVIYTMIALLCFINPSLFILLNSLQKIDEIGEMAMSRTEGTRLIGIGANFFTSAIVNGTILILLGVCISAFKYSVKEKFVLIIAYAIISVLGLMMARTLMFGMLIGGVFILSSFVRSLKDLIQTIFVILSFGLLAIALIPVLFKNFAVETEVLTSFGFEMFINKSQGGKMESHSMLVLYEMWKTLPQNSLTWIIGDGLWTTWDGRYYMSVDLGYLRDIWYFGIVGTILLFRYYYFTLKIIFENKKLFFPKQKLVTLGLFIFVLILNAKGPCDLFLYVIPFYFSTNTDL